MMATKRKRVAFADMPATDEDEQKDNPPEKRARTFKEKHSLDSDEEDKPDDAGELDDEDLAYQERSTISWDEGQKITPFNLQEEMEEGRFDAHGNYYAKEDEDVADGWLDSVNWEKVRAEEDSEDENSKGNVKKTERSMDDDVRKDSDDSSDENDDDNRDGSNPSAGSDTINLLKKAVAIVKPGETIAGAMRRLGTSTARPKFRKGKGTVPASDGLSVEERAERRAALSNLTDIADNLVQMGRMAVYEETYEKFSFEIREHENQFMDAAVKGEKVGSSEVLASDMTAEHPHQADCNIPHEVLKAATAGAECSEVCWLLKWTNASTSQLLGPFSSTQMDEWSQQGLFGEDGVFVRKAKDTSADFYSSKRIDFDLYVD